PEPPGHGDANGPAVGGETSGRAADLQETPEAVCARANGTGDAHRERGLCRPAALAGRQGSTDGVPREAKAGLHEVEGAGDGTIGFSRFNKCGRAPRGFSQCPPHQASRCTRTKMIPTAQSLTVRRIAAARMPTKWGMFQTMAFERVIVNGTRHTDTALALVLGDLTDGTPLVRIHSQCFTGEVLGSLRCDCNDQLEIAMRAIAAEGRGLVIYEHQEGRGIGLMAKLQAYELQDAGLDTVDANHALGFLADCRDFGLPAAILHELRVSRVRLLSNNPRKSRALSDAGIAVVERLPCEAAPTPHSLAYLRAKKEKMGHALSLGQHERTAYPHHSQDRFEFASVETAIR